LQNSASQRCSTSASLSSRGRIQGPMKPPGPLVTTTAITTTPSRCIASILMAVGHHRIGRRILGHPPQDRNSRSFDQRSPQYSQRVLAVIKCIYLSPIYLYFIQDIEDMFLLSMSSTSFVDLPLQEHQMMEKHHMDQNPYIS
jgi:hypothetical protein